MGFLPTVNIKTTSTIPLPKSYSLLLLPNERLYQDSKEESYSARIYYDISKLDPSDSIGYVIVPLSKRIAELGFPTNIVEIRVEKGSLFPSNDLSWHYDGDTASASIIVSFSNNPNWSTRLIDQRSKEEIAGKKERLVARETPLIKQLDDKAELASLGYLYNAKTTFHRAPKMEDFSERPIEANDWRIFLQFMVNKNLELRE